MPWNQPGANGPDDPWGHDGRGARNRRGDGPPDLDEIFREARNRIDSMFGGRGGRRGRGRSQRGENKKKDNV